MFRQRLWPEPEISSQWSGMNNIEPPKKREQPKQRACQSCSMLVIMGPPTSMSLKAHLLQAEYALSINGPTDPEALGFANLKGRLEGPWYEGSGFILERLVTAGAVFARLRNGGIIFTSPHPLRVTTQFEKYLPTNHVTNMFPVGDSCFETAARNIL